MSNVACRQKLILLSKAGKYFKLNLYLIKNVKSNMFDKKSFIATVVLTLRTDSQRVFKSDDTSRAITFFTESDFLHKAWPCDGFVRGLEPRVPYIGSPRL